MFASKTLTEHLLRGLVGLLAVAASIALTPSHPWLAVAALPLALVALRGCPMCWTLGLIQTAIAKLRARSTEGVCVDGQCATHRTHRSSETGPLLG